MFGGMESYRNTLDNSVGYYILVSKGNLYKNIKQRKSYIETKKVFISWLESWWCIKVF